MEESKTMGFRFRKRIRLFKRAWINLSKKGGSVSVGGHGFTENISRKGHQETVGLPGSGLSYRTRRHKFRKLGGPENAAARPLGARGRYIVIAIAIGLIVLWLVTHVH